MLYIRPISGKVHDLFVADKALGMDSDDDSVLGNRFIALRHINQSQMPIVPTDTCLCVEARTLNRSRFGAWSSLYYTLGIQTSCNAFMEPACKTHSPEFVERESSLARSPGTFKVDTKSVDSHWSYSTPNEDTCFQQHELNDTQRSYSSTEVGIGRRLKDGNRFALATSSKVNLFALPQTQPHRSDRDTEGTGYKMGGWFNLQREPLGFYRGLLPRNFALSGSANPRALDKRF
uniref:Uncharacterized protein n=1 Tax=Vespula pensylvanica TaxID=30213 RepID=A0A834U5B0_VESPE|nr:hypothetical protein H0235_011564 [Vespula pensylvanica]